MPAYHIHRLCLIVLSYSEKKTSSSKMQSIASPYGSTTRFPPGWVNRGRTWKLLSVAKHISNQQYLVNVGGYMPKNDSDEITIRV